MPSCPDAASHTTTTAPAVERGGDPFGLQKQVPLLHSDEQQSEPVLQGNPGGAQLQRPPLQSVEQQSAGVMQVAPVGAQTTL